ncbi:ESPR-type extended signal peptide-containing protein [Lysobacter antibioticus]
MNHIFRIVWSAVSETWVVVFELHAGYRRILR